jgi:hypothetical protein
MSNYYSLRTKPLLEKPVGQPNLGGVSLPFGNLYLKDNLYIDNIPLSSSSLTVPRLTGITYTVGRSTAVTSGDETLTLTGTGFNTGAVVLVDKLPVNSTTVVSSTEVTFVTPQKNAGVYSLFLVNPDGSTGALAVGITYS